MKGFDNIKDRVKLRNQFKEQQNQGWQNEQDEPDIDYVLWLEDMLISYTVKCTCDCPLIRTGENGEYCGDCGKDLE